MVEYYILISGLILGLRPTNERRRYIVATSLIGWAQYYDKPRNLNFEDILWSNPSLKLKRNDE